MIDFLRRSGQWLLSAEYTVYLGAIWMGPLPIPMFRLAANDACKTMLLVLLWGATVTLTVLHLAFGPLPGPAAVGHWMLQQN
ncbi:hypothetical protein [Falsirhodobacter sp. alg1]|uniref:hypothetical protein n=1 Tax=Falsirhodobacter sp. alg1 TaxID=1472418 RepID=UPI0007874DD9|nr:hypothetical protein [Falsirhodobacter sp. alg1]